MPFKPFVPFDVSCVRKCRAVLTVQTVIEESTSIFSVQVKD